jgi:hypothetical protein
MRTMQKVILKEVQEGWPFSQLKSIVKVCKTNICTCIHIVWIMVLSTFKARLYSQYYGLWDRGIVNMKLVLPVSKKRPKYTQKYSNVGAQNPSSQEA